MTGIIKSWLGNKSLLVVSGTRESSDLHKDGPKEVADSRGLTYLMFSQNELLSLNIISIVLY